MNLCRQSLQRFYVLQCELTGFMIQKLMEEDNYVLGDVMTPREKA